MLGSPNGAAMLDGRYVEHRLASTLLAIVAEMVRICRVGPAFGQIMLWSVLGKTL